VAEIMSTDLPGVELGSSIEVCMILMSERNIRYLPVVDNGEMIGIISSNDLIKATIQDHLETIEHLKNYIHA
jgi:CBS domain-containing protein